MTTSLRPESKSPSRRALLAGALGGLGAFAASALGRASEVRAGVDGDVVLGSSQSATATTSIQNYANNATVFLAESATDLGSGGGTALSGKSGSGIGVRGQATTASGVGLSAVGAGIALQTQGRTKFSTSGVATINTGNISVTIAPGVNITSGSFVLLTPKANIGTRTLWFTTNPTTNRFTIHMSSSRSRGTKVAWLLLG
jgi:hypothetical protein